MKLGNKTISILEAGRFRLDGGAMFGVVPRVLWEKRKQPDDKNRIAMATNLLLIQYQDRNILVDTGIGTKYDEKFKKIYAVEDDPYNLTQALEKAGLTAEAITDVILTHLHFDHTGGSTTRNAEGAVVPTFPNARYYVQKSQYEWALNPSEKDRASFFPENYVPLYKTGQLELLDGDGELFPGIRVMTVTGHTPGQQMVRVEGEGQTVLFAADLIPLEPHLSIPWVMAYDLYPLETIREKKAILNRAVEENWIVVFEHDPEVLAGTVTRTEKGFALNETVTV